MKRIQLIVLVLLFCSLLFSMELPFSSTTVKTDSNQLGQLVRIDPDDQKPETLPTQVWLWYDEENLYAEFEAHVDSTFTAGQYASRDDAGNCDYITLYVLTNPESYNCYFYHATPTGVLEDGTMDINNGISYNWNSSYSYTTSINDSVWSAIMKIPFRDLRFKTDPPYKWKLAVKRFHDFSKDNYVYPYYDVNISRDFYLKAVDITLTQKIKKQIFWKFRPYYVKSYDLVNKSTTFDPDNVGLDISFNPGAGTKLKAALNPDFTDVPPDDATDIYNEKYPTYYSENRFFFIEDIDAFGVGSDIFYTRNMVQPQYAVKFTGNRESWTYGYLCAKDRKIEESGYLVNPDDFYQLAALIKTEDKYLAQVAYASRMNTGYYNNVLIGGWNYEFLHNMYIGSSHVFGIRNTDENSEYMGEDKKGLYQAASFELYPGNWHFSLSYSNIQKDIPIDTGYLYDTGYESYSFYTSWKSDTREKYIRKITIISSMGYSDLLEPDHPFYSVGFNTNILINFLPKYYTHIGLNRYSEEYNDKVHERYDCTTILGFFRWPAFKPTLTVGSGKTIIYSLNETKNKMLLRGSFSGSIKRNLSWYASITHNKYYYDRVNYIYTPTDTLVITLDDSYQIANVSLDYNFSNKMTSTTGVGVSTYKSGSRYSNLTFYSNFRYEFKKDWFLYLGYKTGQSQDEPSTLDDFTGHFNRNSASAYLKLSLTL